MRATLLLAVLLIATFGAREARAHGGNFRFGNPRPSGPGTRIPPKVLPGASPSTPGQLGRASGPGRPRRPEVAGVEAYDWKVWWALNRESLAAARQPAHALRPATTTPAALGRDLPKDVQARIRWRRARDLGARRVAIPFLLEILAEDRDGRKALTGVALIALARSARDGVAIPHLRRFAYHRRADREVRECAVIGMGLARRSQPGERLALHQLRTLRRDLMHLFEDSKAHTQLRAFALYSLTLLADQPYGDGVLDRYGRDVTRWLHARLRASRADPDLALALLVALSHQPPQGVTTALLTELEDLALRRYAFRHRWSAPAAALAVHTLVRLRAPGAARVAKTLLRSRRTSEVVQCAACLALAHRTAHASPEERVELAGELDRVTTRPGRSRVKRMALLGLGLLLHEDLCAGNEGVLVETRAARTLHHALQHGSSGNRPYAAIALGLAARDACARSRPSLAFGTETRRALARQLDTASGNDEAMGAYVAAIGLARADVARPRLLEILEDRKRSPVLRGHAALALAEVGQRDVEVAQILIRAARERLHPWLHDQAVRALAILGIPGATQDLLGQFRRPRTQGALVAIAASLGQLGDPRAAAAMIAAAKDREARSSLRIASVLGLGLLFDREERPSRTRLSQHAIFMALPWTLARYIDVR